MRRMMLIAAAACLGAVFGVSNALATPSECDAISGNIVANCGFETGDFTDWARSGNTDHTSVSNTAQFVHSGTYGAKVGPVGSDGYLSQTLATTAGASYAISVWYDPSGLTPSDFDIEWDGTTLLDIPDASPGWETAGTPEWVDEQVTALGSGSDILAISFRDDPNYAGIDDVSVVPSAAVPEPASLSLIVGGLLGFGFLRRRRRQDV